MSAAPPCRSLRTAILAVTLASATAPLAPAYAGSGAPCPGDCDGNGAVTVSDLVTGVNIALGRQGIEACTAMDGNANGAVTINELIRAVGAALDGCPATATPTSADAGTATPTPTSTEPPTLTPTETPSPVVRFCDLPGSYQTTGPGMSVVSGAAAGPDLSYLDLPIGFCAHFFANVGNPRELRFAPSGELFVASPTRFTTGNGAGGQAAILVLADDDGDGSAEVTTKFLRDSQNEDVVLRETVGLLFANGYLYYQDATRIMRVPYSPGERTTSSPSEQVADIQIYVDTLHWPKTLDIADDGTIYVGNGSYEGEGNQTIPPYEECYLPDRPFRGGILKLDGSPGGTPVAKGFRNPISVKCARGHNLCFAIELAKDYSYSQGGREKIVPIRDGDDWGFPCCGTKDTPYAYIQPPPDCSHVAQESESFYIGNTPFDIDFETGKWPEPWKNHAFVPLHGAAGLWTGARVVAVDMDAMTGQLLPGSDLSGMSSGAMSDFATGWPLNKPGNNNKGRPAVVTFAEDGRLFLGNDYNGDIIWIAPLELEIPR